MKGPVESEVSIDHRADWKVEHRSNGSAARQRLTTTRLVGMHLFL